MSRTCSNAVSPSGHDLIRRLDSDSVVVKETAKSGTSEKPSREMFFALDISVLLFRSGILVPRDDVAQRPQDGRFPQALCPYTQ